MKLLKKKQNGFTVVELMIATTIFGVVILIASAAVIMLGRQFYKGLISSKVQEVNRQVVDEIGRNIQFTAAQPSVRTNGNVVAICTSEKEYFIERYKRVTSTDRAVVRFNDCAPAAPVPSSIPASWAGDSGTELLTEGMRVSNFSIANLANPRAWKLDLGVLHAENEYARDSNGDGQMDSCKGGPGSEFCASSTLSVTVFKPL